MLRRNVEAAIALSDAQYGALGVINDTGGLSEFLRLGIDEEAGRGSGPCRRARVCWARWSTPPCPCA